MRYIVFGAGAIGGTIGARLYEHGFKVTLIARGAHLAALREHGLRLQSPGHEVTLPIPACATAAEAEIGRGDRVVLATKTQDSARALDDLAAVCGPETPIVCAQNGVENERAALRRFGNVYGVRVILPAEHLSPGVVRHDLAPVAGLLDVGTYPAGSDGVAESLVRDLSAAGFASRLCPDVMRWKYAKLLGNLANSLEAACGPAARESDVADRTRAEGEACLRASGIDWASRSEDAAAQAVLAASRPAAGTIRAGGSSWQSLARATGSIEADYLNGEIVLLGRLHGVATPMNAALQRIANRMARERLAPGSLSVNEVEAEVRQPE